MRHRLHIGSTEVDARLHVAAAEDVVAGQGEEAAGDGDGVRQRVDEEARGVDAVDGVAADVGIEVRVAAAEADGVFRGPWLGGKVGVWLWPKADVSVCGLRPTQLIATTSNQPTSTMSKRLPTPSNESLP